MNVSAFETGVYFCEVTHDNSIFRRKLVVK
ncbi:MAG: T9SS type A sorting domain-containing protein [Crocinitomicaceae bacterium]|nr:T9SS type A sorting domain-containing protein [Crocinitomicaceae bacterium]